MRASHTHTHGSTHRHIQKKHLKVFFWVGVFPFFGSDALYFPSAAPVVRESEMVFRQNCISSQKECMRTCAARSVSVFEPRGGGEFNFVVFSLLAALAKKGMTNVCPHTHTHTHTRLHIHYHLVRARRRRRRRRAADGGAKAEVRVSRRDFTAPQNIPVTQ